MKKLLFLLNILILFVLTSCVDKYEEPISLDGNIDYSSAGMSEGHAYVDLGLSVKWATCNLSAITPVYDGNPFGWGETTIAKTLFTEKLYKWYQPSGSSDISEMTKYVSGEKGDDIDNRTVLELIDDAANVHWGGNWRIPTKEELEELINNCTWTWTTQKEVYDTREGQRVFTNNGYKVTSNINGNSIFLPASGIDCDGKIYGAHEYTAIWANSKPIKYGLYSSEENSYAYCLITNEDSIRITGINRYYGIAVRPVLADNLTCTISFNSNGADGNMSSITAQCGELVQLPPMSYKCKGFVGWNTKADGTGVMYNDGDKITVSSDIELYAQWVRLSCESFFDANGHEYVDLGLSVKWATCNIGASSPEELGDKYAWGEVQTKQEFTWNNYQLCVNGDYTKLTKYCPKDYWLYDDFSESVIDNKTQLEFEDDAARVHWGGTWAIPSESEVNELIDPNNCVWIKSHRNNVAGYEVISKINGNSIFIPFMDKFDNGEGVGIYWASTIPSTQHPEMGYALYLREDKNIGTWGAWDRYWGWYIRPVLL